jgi:hypothetical protein
MDNENDFSIFSLPARISFTYCCQSSKIFLPEYHIKKQIVMHAAGKTCWVLEVLDSQ